MKINLRFVAATLALMPFIRASQGYPKEPDAPYGQTANQYVFANDSAYGLSPCIDSVFSNGFRACIQESIIAASIARRIRTAMLEARAQKARGGSDAIAAKYMARREQPKG